MNQVIPQTEGIKHAACYYLWTGVVLAGGHGLSGREKSRWDTSYQIASSVFEELRQNGAGILSRQKPSKICPK